MANQRRPDWSLWGKIPDALLWQVIFVSMDIEPGISPDDIPFELRDEYRRRFLLSESHVHRKELAVVAWPRRSQNSNMEYAVVELKAFGAFSRKMELKIPDCFPVDPVNWDKWGRSDVVELWQAVAIATKHSPDGATCANAKASFGADFNEMLAVALSCAGASLAIHSVDEPDAFSGYGDDPRTLERRTRVHLAKFREWSEGKGYALADRFPRVAKTSEPKQPAQPENKATSAEVTPTSKWPWGNHETELLRHLDAAGAIWKTKYDPKFPATAPTNDDIERFLEQRGVSVRVRQVMAQILRADGLRSGPRVNR